MVKQVLFYVLSVFGVQQAYADEFLFCFENQHFAPFLMGSGDLIQGQGGIVPDMMLLTSEVVGLPLNFERRPWKRCQAELAQGEIDALAAFLFSEARDQWAAFPKTNGILDDRYFYQSDYMIFTYPGSGLSWDGSLLLPANAKVQSSPGYLAEQKLKAMGFEPIAQLQANKAIPLVSRRLLDGFVMDALVGKTLIKELGLEGQVVPLAVPFMNQHWYAVFSKQTYAQRSEEVEAFWTALRAVRIEQSDTLFKRYE
jgi:polar amino acid transport system substrate-binding protein